MHLYFGNPLRYGAPPIRIGTNRGPRLRRGKEFVTIPLQMATSCNYDGLANSTELSYKKFVLISVIRG